VDLMDEGWAYVKFVGGISLLLRDCLGFGGSHGVASVQGRYLNNVCVCERFRIKNLPVVWWTCWIVLHLSTIEGQQLSLPIEY
jgi:hypothetical protein